MLYYHRIDLSEGMDHTKTNISKKCIVCHYWLFNHGFESQDPVCNSCHDLTMLCLNISDRLLLLKGLIIVTLFITLANLKQFVC